MQEPAHEESPPLTSAFAETHCMICAAGWTRTGAEGERITICLLNRERVWPQMVECDRFEGKDLPQPEAADETLAQQGGPGLPSNTSFPSGKA